MRIPMRTSALVLWISCFRKVKSYETKKDEKIVALVRNIYMFPVASREHQLAKMNRTSDLLKPPQHVHGMTELDKERFQKTIQVPTLQCKGVNVSKVLPLVKKYLLKLERFKPVQHTNDNTTVIHLNPNVIGAWSEFPDDVKKSLEDVSITADCFSEKSLKLTYDNFSADEVFKAVLPPDREGCSSFTKTGHIVHVNLREHLLPYKFLIGKVLHDKIMGCRSVVNKVDMIDSTYRYFKMEVLCGDSDTVVTVKHIKCSFQFDFATVYWNSRLSTEHERIVGKLNANDVLFDVFAGVGPFAIPAAKKKCIVYANDLNPESYDWLNRNKKLNKIDDKFLKTFNKDGRDFIMSDIKEVLPELVKKHTVYITMNLPALAVEFLDSFVGLFKDNLEMKAPPTLFVYCFAKGEDSVAIAKDLVLKGAGADISEFIVEMFNVRTVSSMKEMMRVTIKLHEDILTGKVASAVTKRKLEDEENKKITTATMGKNKKKINSVFKVAGAKSLKLKAKAKAVKSNLKNINLKNKDRVSELDKQFVEMQKKNIQQASTNKKNVKKPSTNKLPDTRKKELETQNQSQNTIECLNDMKL